MVSESQLAKTICLSSQSKIREICSYLAQNFGIDHFGYIKCFADGTHIGLNTHSDWMEHVYLNCYKKYDVFYKTIDAYSSGSMLWSTIKDQSSFQGFKEHSGVNYGIVLIQKNPDSCEFYNFATSQKNSDVINFYLNNFNILWHHIYYFKDKAHDLVKKADADRLILPKCNIAKPEDALILDKKQIDNILTTAPIERYYFNIENKEVYLTNSEAKCCFYLVQGRSIKEIAKLTNASPRTVEHHLNNTKMKLNCLNKAHLIRKILYYTNLTSIYML